MIPYSPKTKFAILLPPPERKKSESLDLEIINKEDPHVVALQDGGWCELV